MFLILIWKRREKRDHLNTIFSSSPHDYWDLLFHHQRQIWHMSCQHVLFFRFFTFFIFPLFSNEIALFFWFSRWTKVFTSPFFFSLFVIFFNFPLFSSKNVLFFWFSHWKKVFIFLLFSLFLKLCFSYLFRYLYHKFHFENYVIHW